MLNSELQKKVEQTKQFILDNYNPNIKTAFSFSGGKDAVIVDYLLKECGISLDNILFFYLASGMETDGFKTYMEEQYPYVRWLTPGKPLDKIWKENKHMPVVRRADVNYKIARDPIPYTEENKYEAYCCHQIRYARKFKALKHYSHIFCGAKGTDKMNRADFPQALTLRNGKLYICPIHDWTDEECWEFIKENNIPVCIDYERLGGTFTCPLCCLFSEKHQAKAETVLKQYYPELYARYENAAKYCYENDNFLQTIFPTWEDFFEAWKYKSIYREKVYAIKGNEKS